MIEFLTGNFIDNHDESTAINIIRYCRYNALYNLGVLFGNFFEERSKVVG